MLLTKFSLLFVFKSLYLPQLEFFCLFNHFAVQCFMHGAVYAVLRSIFIAVLYCV